MSSCLCNDRFTGVADPDELSFMISVHHNGKVARNQVFSLYRPWARRDIQSGAEQSQELEFHCRGQVTTVISEQTGPLLPMVKTQELDSSKFRQVWQFVVELILELVLRRE